MATKEVTNEAMNAVQKLILEQYPATFSLEELSDMFINLAAEVKLAKQLRDAVNKTDDLDSFIKMFTSFKI